MSVPSIQSLARSRVDHLGARLACVALVALVAATGLLATSCNDPQAPADSTSTGFRATYRPSGGGTLEFQLDDTSGQATPFRLIASNLTYDPSTQQLHADVALRNSGNVTLPGPRGVMVMDFTPETVEPVNAVPLLCINPPCAEVFDHRGTYGDDELLGPGETSSPLEWIFLDPDAASFAFRALIDVVSAPPGSGEIGGLVFADLDGDGHPGPGEAGIAGIGVMLQSGDVTQYTTSDPSGRYRFFVTAAGMYEVSVDGSQTGIGCTPTTPAQLQVVILQQQDGSLSSFLAAHFGCGGGVVEPDSEIVVGVVFDDQNLNGQHDFGEPGVPNVRVEAGSYCRAACGGSKSTFTNAEGRYELHDPAGCCPLAFVQHDPLPGWIDTTPNPVQFPFITPAPGQIEVNFGIAQGDSTPFPQFNIQGVVYMDTNANGVRDRGEAGVEDIEVWASGMCLTPVVAYTHTDSGGNYLLRGADVHCFLPWWVTRGLVPGTYDTTPSAVTLTEPPPDGDTYHIDFGVAPADSTPVGGIGVQGYVFLDLDEDGVRDRGEAGIEGALLQLLTPCNMLHEVRTDATGFYGFRPALVGSCPALAVALVEPKVRTTTPNPGPIVPDPSGAVGVVNFGVARVAAPPGTP